MFRSQELRLKSTVLFIAVLGSLLSACGKSSSSADAGSCQISQTQVVNTYSVIGKWKKITGYNPQPSDQSLALNYEYWIFEPGTNYCVTQIKNGASFASLANGTYSVDSNLQTIALQTMGSAGYFFNGSCQDTQMVFSYQNSPGASATFILLDKNAAVGDCHPSP